MNLVSRFGDDTIILIINASIGGAPVEFNPLKNIVGLNPSKTKDQLRNYDGEILRIVYLTDVVGPNLAIYSPYDLQSLDSADVPNQINPIIIDAEGRRYRILDIITVLSFLLEGFIPDSL